MIELNHTREHCEVDRGPCFQGSVVWLYTIIRISAFTLIQMNHTKSKHTTELKPASVNTA